MTFHPHLRLAVRTWRRAPGFTLIAGLSIAAAMALGTTVFALVYGVLVRPLPFPSVERLVFVTSHDARSGNLQPPIDNSNRMSQFLDWQQNAPVFDELAAWSGTSKPDVYTISGIGSSQRVTGLRVTAGLLPMLGAVAARGRLFTREDDRVGAPQVVVLSEGYWRSRFGARDDVVGRSVTIENRPCVIAGVVSQEFPLLGSLFAGAPIDIYLPLTRDPAADNIGAFMTVLGRLRAGATLEQAGAILAARRPVIAAGRPWMSTIEPRLIPLRELATGSVRTPLLLLLGAVGCVLAMVCANLTNLFLVRATGRQRETQIRRALGARPRYFRTVGIPMIEGRDFDTRDKGDAPGVVIVNASLARRLQARGLTPLGTTFRVTGRNREVVAIVGDVRSEALNATPRAEVYLPCTQAPGWQAYDLVVRGAENAIAIVPAVREAVWRVDRQQAIGNPLPLQELIDRTVRPHRVLTSLLLAFASVALLLAALGVYSTVNYRVAQRLKEVAIRLAVGAPGWRVTWTVMRETLVFAVLGVALGIPLGLIAGRMLRGFLFGVEATDATTLMIGPAVLIAIALLAAFFPARRTTRVDPAQVLRAE